MLPAEAEDLPFKQWGGFQVLARIGSDALHVAGQRPRHGSREDPSTDRKYVRRFHEIVLSGGKPPWAGSTLNSRPGGTAIIFARRPGEIEPVPALQCPAGRVRHPFAEKNPLPAVDATNSFAILTDVANQFANNPCRIIGGPAVMPRPTSTQPTEVEMQILRILWELGPSPVREIHRRLNAAKGTNYSTTVKMLAVMLQKGLVKRDEDAQPHVYRPTLTRAKTGKRMLDDLIEKVYDGSTMSLVLQALSSGKATKEELDEIRRLLDQMEDK